MPQTATQHQCAQSQLPTTMRFCPRVAAAIGVSEAIILHRLDYWLSRSKHRFEGRAWIYNTYDSWKDQFPFWSRRTIQATFRRLERLSIVESTQAHNRSRWDKTKWYTIDYARLAELVPEIPVVEASAVDEPVAVPSMTPDGPLDDTEMGVIDDEESASSWISKNSPMKSSDEILKRACEGEPDEEARQPALEDKDSVATECHDEDAFDMIEIAEANGEAWDDVDVAFEMIPAEERPSWLERAKSALREQGTPWLEGCVPVVRALAFKMWGLDIPVDAEAAATG